jgi:hypothetical protein
MLIVHNPYLLIDNMHDSVTTLARVHEPIHNFPSLCHAEELLEWHYNNPIHNKRERTQGMHGSKDKHMRREGAYMKGKIGTS